jgi:photosystem II stability/assembly factor-like uncharacterized protein
MKRGSVSLICVVVLCLAVVPQLLRAATLFGLVNTGELFASNDDGTTWAVRSSIPVSDAVAIAAGESSDELFMATRSGSIYRSSDGGTSWTAIGAVTASDVVEMAIRENGDIFLLSEKGTVWRSDDDGVTFTTVSTLTASNHVGLALDIFGGVLYALTRTGEVARSIDLGTTWTVVGAVTTPDAVAIRFVKPDLYVLTGAGDIAKSTDGGATWMIVGTISQVHMTGLTTNGTDLVAVTEEGLVATSSNGVNWSFAGSISQLTVVAIGNDTPTVTGIGGQVPPLSPLRVRALWPNPARGSVGAVTVLFELGQPDQVVIKVYDVAGKLVGEGTPRAFARVGEYTLRWDAGGLASGVYFVQLVSESGFTAVTKFAIVH